MTVEDRLRATTEALSGVMREVPPLTLPSERPGPVSELREPRPARGWLVPLTAAVAVIAVAVALVAVRDSRGVSPAPPAANPVASTIPRYYVTLGADSSAPGYQRDAIVGDSRTGKVLATVRPPARLTFVGVTGAADDRTFVLDAISGADASAAGRASPGTHSWYRLRLAPGSSRPATLTRLRIAGPADSAQVDGLALSPDGGTLAVLYQSGVLGGSPGPFTLRTFSLVTGKTLRTWTAPGGKIYVYGGGERDNDVGLTWTADGRTLAFVFNPWVEPDYERTLSVTDKGDSLLADSRAVLEIPSPQYDCTSVLLASDGRTIVCGALGNRADECRKQWPAFLLYSTATGKLIRVLYRSAVSVCAETTIADLLWSGSRGTAIGAIQTEHIVKNRVINELTFGLLTPGKFTPLHVTLPDKSYFYSPGELAF
jgi:hypothetical protein